MLAELWDFAIAILQQHPEIAAIWAEMNNCDLNHCRLNFGNC